MKWMQDPWTVLLELYPKNFVERTRELSKLQHWMKAEEGPIKVHIVVVYKKGQRPSNPQLMLNKIFKAVRGTLWVSERQIEGLFLETAHVGSKYPTPRIVLQFWKTPK